MKNETTRTNADAAPGDALRCAFLTVASTPWFVQLIRVAPGIELEIPNAKDLGLPWLPNPCGLREDEGPDLVLFTSDWYKWLAVQHADRLDWVFGRLKSRARALVGLDGYDPFALAMPPDGVARADVVLKAQGLYRDRAMYNYRIGPFFPGGNWTKMDTPRRRRYSDDDLSKLRLSLPCFAATESHIRARIRALRGGRNPSALAAAAIERVVVGALPLTPLPRHATPPVHCVGSLTHLQRLEVMEALGVLGYPGLHGVTTIPTFFHGSGCLTDDTGHRGDWEDCDLRVPPPEEDPAMPGGPPSRVSGDGGPLSVDGAVIEDVVARIASGKLRRGNMHRLRFLFSMTRSAVVIAPTGFGELTFRHAEAFVARRALVTQDLRHVETMYPFKQDENVVFCRPDFSDLGVQLRRLADDHRLLQSIATRGQEVWRRWSNGWRGLLEDGIVAPLREAADRTSQR